MSYTLIRECEVVLIYKGVGYRFDALSDFQFSQTFSRNSSYRKTLHSKVSRPLTLATSRNPASFSMSVLATDTYIEGVFFELMGMRTPGKNIFRFPESLPVSPELCEVYIINKNQIFKLDKAFIQNVDTPLTLGSVLKFDVSFAGSSITRVRSLPLASGTLSQGNPLQPSPIQFILNNTAINHIINSGISIQQTTSWRQDKTIHNIGTIHEVTTPILKETSITASITTHLNKRVRTPDEPFRANVRLQQSGLFFDLRNILLIKRFNPEDIFQEVFDLSITEGSEHLVVEYGGLLI